MRGRGPATARSVDGVPPAERLAAVARRPAVTTALVAGAAAVLLLPAFGAPGSELDDGILVSFPARVADGDLPYRDFETFYGPAQSFLVGGAFALLGADLWIEHVVGLLLRVLLVVGVFLVARRFGVVSGLAGAAVALALIGGSVDSHPDIGARAFVVLTLALAGGAVGTRLGEHRRGLATGLATGVAGLFRPEALVAGIAAALPALVRAGGRERLAVAAGAALALLPYLPLALATGWTRLVENVDDLRETSSARRLPFPGPTGEAGRLLALTLIALTLVAAAGIVLARRRDPRSVLLLGAALATLTRIPFGLNRADALHLGAAGFLVIALVPAALAVLVARRRTLTVIASATLVLAWLAASPTFRGPILDELRIAAGTRTFPTVEHRGREFVITSRAAASDLNRSLPLVDRLTNPGDRLFVGPRDLRRTNQNDVFAYYLFPELDPATAYLELDPPHADPGSRLAADVAGADVLLLSTRWDAWTEPNDSALYGSPEPNRVVERDFCRRAQIGTYSVWERCR